MFDVERIGDWRGQDVVDPEGQRVGRLEEVYQDNYGTSPGFACVKTGLFGRRLSFVPLTGASMAPDHVRVAYLADQIKHAPSVEPDGALTGQEEAALFEYYGLNSPGYAETQLPGAPPDGSPRLMRYHAEAAAAHLTEARQIAAADVTEARRMADARRDPGFGPGGPGDEVIEARLAALEARVAALERGRGGGY